MDFLLKMIIWCLILGTMAFLRKIVNPPLLASFTGGESELISVVFDWKAMNFDRKAINFDWINDDWCVKTVTLACITPVREAFLGTVTFDTKFIILNTKFIILNTKFVQHGASSQNIAVNPLGFGLVWNVAQVLFDSIKSVVIMRIFLILDWKSGWKCHTLCHIEIKCDKMYGISSFFAWNLSTIRSSRV